MFLPIYLMKKKFYFSHLIINENVKEKVCMKVLIGQVNKHIQVHAEVVVLSKHVHSKDDLETT